MTCLLPYSVLVALVLCLQLTTYYLLLTTYYLLLKAPSLFEQGVLILTVKHELPPWMVPGLVYIRAATNPLQACRPGHTIPRKRSSE